jgi:hypothetical protein
MQPPGLDSSEIPISSRRLRTQDRSSKQRATDVYRKSHRDDQRPQRPRSSASSPYQRVSEPLIENFARSIDIVSFADNFHQSTMRSPSVHLGDCEIPPFAIRRKASPSAATRLLQSNNGTVRSSARIHRMCHNSCRYCAARSRA